MRIIKKPEERRNEILDAAEMLFASKGFNQTTINDILTEIGIAKGTFYYYFKSKEEVMDAIIDRFIASGVEAAAAVANRTDLKAPEKLLHIIMSQNADSPGKEQMIEQLHQIRNAEMHQKSLVETILKLTPVITKVIEDGIEEGFFSTPYPRETVEFLLVSSQFLFDEGLFQWQPEELARKAAAFVHIMESALNAKPGTFDFIERLLSGPTGGE
ncbi:TetR/AcrR family transcriptional regulator [Paenibacillus sp. NEAU-GSW1]|uniref:TetR/AcrR family transcriptional regulator n=1 Tax=Paenibacillus sp. NEAU-GSW1 TaxID=2682486 RepID=UPI0012E139AD|nr:TetR/AcrR family transcriptional regulator [Paenibacillus sp. NEAU-GSW1]MUT68304.1 TetR family transcriptional regulator [Paenibacillus sp. NEAU-GSW1]